MTDRRTTLPKTGQDWDHLKITMQTMRQDDVDWKRGRAAVYVFYAGDDVLQVAQEAYGMFMSENGLGMMRAFPSLHQMEQDIIAIALDLLNAGEEAVGNMTSGGTESIFLAVKTAHDWARAQRPQVQHPEIVVPYSAHPAFRLRQLAERYHGHTDFCRYPSRWCHCGGLGGVALPRRRRVL